MNVTCIKHRDYKGEKAPVLSCKSCCAIYIAAIKRTQLAQRQTELGDEQNQMAPAGNQTF